MTVFRVRSRAHSQATRDRLLEVAGEFFAEHGFRGARIRDICRAAGANVAAVNYHFSDKAGLYREVISRGAHARMPAAMPESDTSADPASSLRTFIDEFVERVLGERPAAWMSRVMAREMIEPSEALDIVARDHVGPLHAALGALIRRLLAEAASDETVQLVTGGVEGQVLFYKHCRPMIERLSSSHTFDASWRRTLARYVWRSTLATIRDVRAEHAGRGGNAASETATETRP